MDGRLSCASAKSGLIESARANGFYGTPEQIAERVNAYREIGASRSYLQLPDLHDIDHVDAIAEILPLVRG